MKRLEKCKSREEFGRVIMNKIKNGKNMKNKKTENERDNGLDLYSMDIFNPTIYIFYTDLIIGNSLKTNFGEFPIVIKGSEITDVLTYSIVSDTLSIDRTNDIFTNIDAVSIPPKNNEFICRFNANIFKKKLLGKNTIFKSSYILDCKYDKTIILKYGIYTDTISKSILIVSPAYTGLITL